MNEGSGGLCVTKHPMQVSSTGKKYLFPFYDPAITSIISMIGVSVRNEGYDSSKVEILISKTWSILLYWSGRLPKTLILYVPGAFFELILISPVKKST